MVKKVKQITIYGENWCPYCRNAKELAKRISKKVSFVSGKSGEELKKKLKLKKIKQTIPQIVVDGKHIGGFNKLLTKYNK